MCAGSRPFSGAAAAGLGAMAGSGVKCPPLERYLDRLIDYALETWRARRGDGTTENDDPLDRPMR